MAAHGWDRQDRAWWPGRGSSIGLLRGCPKFRRRMSTMSFVPRRKPDMAAAKTVTLSKQTRRRRAPGSRAPAVGILEKESGRAMGGRRTREQIQDEWRWRWTEARRRRGRSALPGYLRPDPAQPVGFGARMRQRRAPRNSARSAGGYPRRHRPRYSSLHSRHSRFSPSAHAAMTPRALAPGQPDIAQAPRATSSSHRPRPPGRAELGRGQAGAAPHAIKAGALRAALTRRP